MSNLADLFDNTDPADEPSIIPPGEYEAHVINGEQTQSHSGKECYKLTFRVCDGEHEGRKFWHDLWLTPAAMQYTKRDLMKLGITSLEQLQQPLPHGIRCRVKLAVRKSDGGSECNRVVSFAVIGRDEPKPDPFAPKPADPKPDRKPADKGTKRKGGKK